MNQRDLASLAPMLGGVGAGGGGDSEYLFEEDAKKTRRSWGDRLTYTTGCAVGVGAAIGVGWGTYEAVTTKGLPSMRLRINAVLNRSGARMGLLTSTGGVLALMYTTVDWAAREARGGEDDIFNSVAAGAITGMIYRSTAGSVRHVAIAGAAGAVGFGLLAAVGTQVPGFPF